eukprot:228171-Hanusia_phi.AAC.1
MECEEKAFFINLYNLMVLHAFAQDDLFASATSKTAFSVGIRRLPSICTFYINVNRYSHATSRSPPFAKNDPRLDFALPNFTSESVEEELRVVAMAFLEMEENLKVDKTLVWKGFRKIRRGGGSDDLTVGSRLSQRRSSGLDQYEKFQDQILSVIACRSTPFHEYYALGMIGARTRLMHRVTGKGATMHYHLRRRKRRSGHVENNHGQTGVTEVREVIIRVRENLKQQYDSSVWCSTKPRSSLKQDNPSGRHDIN